MRSPTIAAAMLLSVIPGAARATVPATAGERPASASRAEPPRIDGDVTVDGNLDEAIWKRAALLTGFTQFAPTDGVPAADSTQVLVWYSANAIYFGVRAFEAHGPVHPNLAQRDHIDAEDRIEFLVSTANDGRQAYDFQVNPLGVQADGTLVETTQNVNGGNGSVPGARQAPDLSADFVFESKGRVTDYGYEVEIRIPFKSIRYQSATTQDWGLNVVRHVQHSGYDDTWAPVKRASASFLAQSGTLAGLTDLRRGIVLDVNPEVTETADGSPQLAGGWGYRVNHVNVGGNVRWGVTSEMTLNATVHPDFSQVEADAGQLSYDPRSALFFPERRPFFLDGIEQFNVPNQLVYTRQIVQPVAAAKLTGTFAGANVALLSAADDPSTSIDGVSHPLFNIARVQRDIGTGARIGALVTDREDGSSYNRVGGLDARAVFGGIYTLQGQAVTSSTRIGTLHESGPLWALGFQRNGRTFGMDYAMAGVDPGFITQSGFVGTTDVVNAHFAHSISHYGGRDAFLQSIRGTVSLAGTWRYTQFVRHGDLRDKKLHFDVNGVLRGGWTAGLGVYTETFGYDESLYSAYRVVLPAIARAPDTVAFTGRPRIPNHDYLINVATPQGSHLAATAFVLFGQDENFLEWQQAHILFATLTIDWRPTQQLRMSASYQHQQYARTDDGSIVAIRRLPYLKWEYQISRPAFVRIVTQYDAQERGTLRDDGRTNAPVLFFNPDSGTYAPALLRRTNNVSTQVLFSYQPVPGTVFYTGYGSALDEPRSFRLRELNRVNDGFFVKLSYLFRMQ